MLGMTELSGRARETRKAVNIKRVAPTTAETHHRQSHAAQDPWIKRVWPPLTFPLASL